MEWWNQMSSVSKWISGIAASILTVGASFATIGGGIDKADSMIVNEDELAVSSSVLSAAHDKDTQMLLEQLIEQNTRIEQYAEREDRREVNDLINRNNRELSRLKRDLVGQKYANPDEREIMVQTISELSAENIRLKQE